MPDIVAAAERRLRGGGYDELSVSQVARELGLAQNAIYWYFPSKNHLFVAALQHMLSGVAARKPSGLEIDERILWFSDELATLYALRSAMYEQAQRSPVVAGFTEHLDALVARMLGNALRGRVPDEDLETAAETLQATIVGTYVQALDPASRHRVLAFAIQRLTR